jgi:uncharacterized membrane protein YkvA (DUF1232 family)
MVTQLIRQQIAQALALPHSNQVFAERMQEIASAQNLSLDDGAIAQYAALATNYIEDTVNLLDACAIASQQAGVAPQVMPLLELVGQYFLNTQDYIPDNYGLYGLLDDAYIAKNLLVQISAVFQQYTGYPLLQITLEGDNALVRTIIGEPLASTLDQEVANTLQTAIVQQQVSQLYGQGTLDVGSRTGGPGSWGGCIEDEIARLGAECGISINY